jgi:ABC-type multidrug transport system fused ATPase/permease subunit
MASDFGTFIIQMLWIFFIIMYFFLFFTIVMDLFSDHTMGGGAKALWIICLILFTYIAVLVYVIARGKGMAERRQAQYKQAEQAQKAYIQEVAGSGATPADQITSAKALLDAGTISQAEFDSLKAKALA